MLAIHGYRVLANRPSRDLEGKRGALFTFPFICWTVPGAQLFPNQLRELCSIQLLWIRQAELS
eukprot:m.231698 g.231698  ORF g.231698 m.231698 type:complete len:63 (-) comp15222_c1_seq1:208-396(-)